MDNAKIAFIGCGNMGRSLIGGLIDSGYDRGLICAADPDQHQRGLARDNHGIVTTADNGEAIEAADVVVLAVKPQVLRATLLPLQDVFAKPPPLVISIVAGVRIRHLNHWLNDATPVIRVMPNTPAQVRSGAAGMIANRYASESQKRLAEVIIGSVGIVLWLENESAIDAVTALSGSGPAYFFLVMEAIEYAGIDMGLSAEQARRLTLATAQGAAKMALESGVAPATLRRQVTSPGGTTERAIDILQAGDLSKLFKDALEAARARAEELAGLIE